MGEIENDGCLTNQVRDNLEPRRACGSGSGTSLDAPRMDRDTGRRIMSSSHSPPPKARANQELACRGANASMDHGLCCGPDATRRDGSAATRERT